MIDSFLNDVESLYLESLKFVKLAKVFLDRPFYSLCFIVRHWYWELDQELICACSIVRQGC